ncbi:MAG: hypothetical protein H7Y22_10240 [Gemmatimonadaceae bacterium]|nr:hypothetical protein [Gloeobacterales cyanobacterium ES-bin-141]
MADAQEIGTAGNGKMLPADEHSPKLETALVETDMQRTRERIAQTANQIERRVKDDLNWQTWVNRYPLPVLGLAAATGALVGLSLPAGAKRTASKTGKDDAIEERVAEQTGKSTLVATVVSTLTTTVLREASNYLIKRFLKE